MFNVTTVNAQCLPDVYISEAFRGRLRKQHVHRSFQVGDCLLGDQVGATNTLIWHGHIFPNLKDYIHESGPSHSKCRQTFFADAVMLLSMMSATAVASG